MAAELTLDLSKGKKAAPTTAHSDSDRDMDVLDFYYRCPQCGDFMTACDYNKNDVCMRCPNKMAGIPVPAAQVCISPTGRVYDAPTGSTDIAPTGSSDTKHQPEAATGSSDRKHQTERLCKGRRSA